MRAFNSESAFSAALVADLRKTLPLVQRIESGLTGRGIPDIYARDKHREYWIELKRVKRLVSHVVEVPWRPGQLSWAWSYFKACGKPTWTFVAMNDVCLFIPINTLAYKDNRVVVSDVYVGTRIEDWREAFNGYYQ